MSISGAGLGNVSSWLRQRSVLWPTKVIVGATSTAPELGGETGHQDQGIL